MIRESFRRKIIESLNESNNLKGVDFFIEETEEYSGVRVSIKYKYKEEYFFNISINSEREQLYHCEASPGTIAFQEKFDIPPKMENILKEINKWSERLLEELLAIPVNRMIEDQNKKIEEIEKMIIDHGDEFLTIEEKEEFVKRLNDLEEKLSKKLDENKSENKELKNKLDKMISEIEGLKKTIDVLSKNNWIKSFLSRAFIWTSDKKNKELLKIGAKVLEGIEMKDINNAIEVVDSTINGIIN